MNADVYIEFSNSPRSNGTLVFVDGNQVNGIRRLEVVAEANDVVRVRMEIIPGDLTIRSSHGETFKAVTESRDVTLIESENSAAFQAEVEQLVDTARPIPVMPVMPESRLVREPQNAHIDWLKYLIRRWGGIR